MNENFTEGSKTMEPVDNNQFEIVPDSKTKRKIAPTCPTAYLNPGLDLLSTEDLMVNTAMEIKPNKKRKRSRSCDIVAFENSALDLGISKSAVSEFLARELENVRRNIKSLQSPAKLPKTTTPDIVNDVLVKENSLTFCDITMNEVAKCESKEHIYANVPLVPPIQQSSLTESAVDMSQIPSIDIDEKIPTTLDPTHMSLVKEPQSNSTVLQHNCNIAKEFGDISNITNIQSNVTNNILINNHTNLSLSFIDRLNIDSPSTSSQSLCLDDDLNESNIMEIKTITIITKKKRVPAASKIKSTNPFLTDYAEDQNVEETSENPFIESSSVVESTADMEYETQVLNRQFETQINHQNGNMMPRRLFEGDVDSTTYTYTEPNTSETHEYENIDGNRSSSPIYENVADGVHDACAKQSKILGHDVSHFTATDIMNLNKMSTEANCSSESNDSKKHNKNPLLKVSNKLSRKVFKTLKKTFKGEKYTEPNTTLNPYEVPRKLPKKTYSEPKECGIENPALNMDNSDEIEIEELGDQHHHYEDIETLRNTRRNINLTPLKERCNQAEVASDRAGTPGKRVRFDATLNQEKVITGNSFELDALSPGFDVKIDKYQDELENCINERKFIRQNMK